jgi:hypothetical protein
MATKHEIRDEWEKVKDVPSLRQHYMNDHKAYMRWRARFIRAGYIPTAQQKPINPEERRERRRAYYSKWRAKNKDKVQATRLKHYAKALAMNAEESIVT